MEEKKIEKKDFYLVESDQTIAFFLSYCNLHLFQYFLFFIFYFISLFTPFLLFMILFSAFYSWTMLEMLQILLLISYKLACHQSQKIIINSYWLYCLNITNHIFTTSVCKIFVVDFVVTMNWLFLLIYFNDMKYIYFLIIFYLFLLWLSINIF